MLRYAPPRESGHRSPWMLVQYARSFRARCYSSRLHRQSSPTSTFWSCTIVAQLLPNMTFLARIEAVSPERKFLIPNTRRWNREFAKPLYR